MSTEIATTDDIRIDSLNQLIAPTVLMEQLPISEKAAIVVKSAREEAAAILNSSDDRVLAVVGPCSIHDTKAAYEYAEKLGAYAETVKDDLQIIMRVYFEKPRTTVGWKGLINDPDMNNSYQINRGLSVARELLLKLAEQGMPSGTEFLDTISPQYIADLVSWGAIGARTTESQVHRELASGLSMPVGFKNGTGGNFQIAIDAIQAAAQPHRFLSVKKSGDTAIVATTGNDTCHIILRGGKTTGPNFDAESVAEVRKALEDKGVMNRIMLDCSHANSGKDYREQPNVCANIAGQIAGGDTSICSVMIESHLHEGNQKADPDNLDALEYGVSVTDSCVSWDTTVEMLDGLAEAVRKRRATFLA
ncbi:MAG: 3-deoxy-7-phosphoheptulonate synthase [Verrucomicrobiales bacterium]|nr:3-deoxy-7-phosphoheptulonate synthase [Verrucomicrobiales bacterium]